MKTKVNAGHTITNIMTFFARAVWQLGACFSILIVLYETEVNAAQANTK